MKGCVWQKFIVLYPWRSHSDHVTSDWVHLQVPKEARCTDASAVDYQAKATELLQTPFQKLNAIPSDDQNKYHRTRALS